MTSTRSNIPQRKRKEIGAKSSRATRASGSEEPSRINSKLAALRRHLGQDADDSDMADNSNENLDLSLDLETERHKVRLICSDDILPADLDALDVFDDNLLQDESEKEALPSNNFMDKVLEDVSKDRSLRFDERVQRLLYLKLHNYVDSTGEDNWIYEGS